MVKSKLRHSQFFEPASRAVHAQKYWADFSGRHAYELDGGKNFPDITGGKAHYQTKDTMSDPPPPDGFILSGGHADIRRKLNLTDKELEDEGFGPWPKIPVQPSQLLEINLKHHEEHKTRGYIAFITKDDWKSDQPITREQLESTPFYENIAREVPFWDNQLPPIGRHIITLPSEKTGHHIMVLLWLIADARNAFYQAYDLDFSD